MVKKTRKNREKMERKEAAATAAADLFVFGRRVKSCECVHFQTSSRAARLFSLVF